MSLVDQLLKATKQDYDEIEKQITERELELNALRETHRVIGIRLGIQHRSKKKASGESADVAHAEVPDVPVGTGRTEHFRKVVREYIQANGPAQPSILSQKTGVPSGSMGGVLNHPMFVKTAIGYGLAENHK
jgi:hypothetical protein